MTVQRIDHVGIVVNDLPAAVEFFLTIGLKLQDKGHVEGQWVDRIVGLKAVRADLVMMQTPDGNDRLELVKFHSPLYEGKGQHAPAHAPGIRHIAIAIEGIDTIVENLKTLGAELIGEVTNYKDIYRLCYVRGPEGIIIELAEQIS